MATSSLKAKRPAVVQMNGRGLIDEMVDCDGRARLAGALLVVLIAGTACGGGGTGAPPVPSFGDQVAPFVGVWVNDDSVTGSNTRLIIDRAGNVHAFGRCHPVECDWQTRIGEFVGGEFRVHFVMPESGHEYQLLLTVEGERLTMSATHGLERFHKGGPEVAAPHALNSEHGVPTG